MNLHANNNVINPEMLEELPSSREEEGILGGRGHDNIGGRSGGTGRGNATTVSAISEEGSIARSNHNGETHYFHCGEEGQWENMFPLLLEDQHSQLQMNDRVQDSHEEQEL